jgi:hypothetical protein
MLPTIATGNVGSALAGEFEVANSLRFNSGSSDRLTRSFSGGTPSLWTWSGWIKRSKLGSRQIIFSAYNNSTTYTTMEFTANDEIKFNDENNNNTNGRIQSTAKYRDPSAWMHIVFHWDSSDSTSSDRLRMYVNNVRVTDFSDTGNAPSTTSQANTDITHEIGSMNNSNFFGGYMAEVCFIDNANLDPDQFGEYDEDSGIWKPKDVSGLSFGTSGFYLDFEDSSSLGNDVSGNNNDWTVSNLTSIDQSTDTCTNNYATLNALDPYHEGTLSLGNLRLVQGVSSYSGLTSTIGVNTGKWYCEMKLVANGSARFGVMGSQPTSNSTTVGNTSDSYAYFSNGSVAYKYNNSTNTSYGDTFTNGDIIGIALDLDNNYIYFSKNGTWQNSGDPTSGSSGTGAAFSLGTPLQGFYWFALSDINDGASGTLEANFGGTETYTISSGNSDGNGYGNFEYSVPSGYYALNTKNLAEYG